MLQIFIQTQNNNINNNNIRYLSTGDRLPRNKQFRIDRVQIPFEAFTLQAIAQLDTFTDIAEIALLIANSLIIIFRKFIEPHFGQTYTVASQHVHAAPPFVRRSFPEDVAHMGAGYNFQCAAAHPRFEWELQILTTPNVEAVIVGAQFLEEFLESPNKNIRVFENKLKNILVRIIDKIQRMIMIISGPVK